MLYYRGWGGGLGEEVDGRLGTNGALQEKKKGPGASSARALLPSVAESVRTRKTCCLRVVRSGS